MYMIIEINYYHHFGIVCYFKRIFNTKGYAAYSETKYRYRDYMHINNGG